MKHTSAQHHYYQNKKLAAFINSARTKKWVDRAMYFLGMLAPIMTLPQVFKIWELRTASGVSSFSWAGYAAGSFAWFVYGVVHREKPIIMTNGFAFLFQATVVISALVFS